MCESLIDQFDPLRISPSPRSTTQSYGDITRPRPVSKARASLDPTSTKKPTNPFLLPVNSAIRPCRSDSNLSVLGLTIPGQNSPLMQPTLSQRVLNDKRLGFISLSPSGSPSTSPKASPKVSPKASPYKVISRPQVVKNLRQDSTTSPMGNPFLEGTDQTQQGELLHAPDEARFWLEENEQDIELQKVDNDNGSGQGAGMGNRTASLDVLNERKDEVLLDYSYRRKRNGNKLLHSLSYSHFSQSLEYGNEEAPSIIPPPRSNKTGTVGISKAISRSPKLFRKKVSLLF